jgi:putative membrane protein
MIVRRDARGLRLLFALRGSILPRIWPRVAFVTLLSCCVVVAHGSILGRKIAMTPVPFSLVGLALAIFLGFRNSASYDRYWEGRKLWGELLNVSRSFARQTLSLVAGDGARELQADMVHRLIGFVHALRHQLRETSPFDELRPLLPADELEEAGRLPSICTFLLQRLAADLRQCQERGFISPWLVAQLDQSLSRLADILGGCERIRGTPLPFTYSVLLHRTVFLFCLLLPFGLVDSIGYMTPVMIAFIAYTFFGLDAVGDELEEPFGLAANDLPLHAMDRFIEINLRQMLGERDLPPPIEATDYNLP